MGSPLGTRVVGIKRDGCVDCKEGKSDCLYGNSVCMVMYSVFDRPQTVKRCSLIGCAEKEPLSNICYWLVSVTLTRCFL